MRPSWRTGVGMGATIIGMILPMILAWQWQDMSLALRIWMGAHVVLHYIFGMGILAQQSTPSD